MLNITIFSCLKMNFYPKTIARGGGGRFHGKNLCFSKLKLFFFGGLEEEWEGDEGGRKLNFCFCGNWDQIFLNYGFKWEKKCIFWSFCINFEDFTKGKNKISSMAKEIALFLKLDNPNAYTGTVNWGDFANRGWLRTTSEF